MLGETSQQAMRYKIVKSDSCRCIERENRARYLFAGIKSRAARRYGFDLYFVACRRTLHGNAPLLIRPRRCGPAHVNYAAMTKFGQVLYRSVNACDRIDQYPRQPRRIVIDQDHRLSARQLNNLLAVHP